MPALRSKYGLRGPIVDAHLCISQPQQIAMRARGLPIPPSIRLQFLIDTGADTTTIAEMHMRSLGIQPTGATAVRTITTDVAGHACNIYGASLRLEAVGFGERAHVLPALEVLGRAFHNEGIDGLIGRDVLGTLALTINGPERQFSITWP